MIRPQGKKKMVAMTSREEPSTRQIQMDKVLDEHEDIFTSLVGVPMHCQLKHSIDLTPGAPLPNGPINQHSILENNEIKKQIEELLQKGYHHVPIECPDVWKIAFEAKEGLFEWLVMPFRLMNPPTTLMRLMDDILGSFTNSFVVVYLDDILIFNQSWEKHLDHI
eukprot:PITA_29392